MPEKELVKTLLDTAKFDADNVEKLADILVGIAGLDNNSSLYARALVLYQYLEKNGGVYSIERNVKINKIRTLTGI